MTPPLMTTLNGTLERHTDGWRWRDGTPEPRVRDLLLGECAPNFRCTRCGDVTYAEIPAGWRSARYWPNGRVDEQAAAAVGELLRSAAGKRSPIFAERFASDRLRLLPVRSRRHLGDHYAH